jgi:hypothetical protein
MQLTIREIWALVHGMLIGGPFLLGFAASLVVLHGLRADYMTADGLRVRVAQLKIASGAVALAGWVIVLIGVWVLLPWYSEATPDSPRSVLLSDPSTRQWHEFADVWKTHAAMMSPILATAAAGLIFYYGPALGRERTVRSLVLTLLVTAFTVAATAALLGSLIARAAPLR